VVVALMTVRQNRKVVVRVVADVVDAVLVVKFPQLFT
jgi:hypothetical protein